jgi:hypothetical protein
MKTADLRKTLESFPTVSGLTPVVINLPPQFKRTIPPPYNVNAILEDSGSISVYASVLIPQTPMLRPKQIETPFNVTQVFSLDSDGKPKLQFYFCYNGAYDSRALNEFHYRLTASDASLPSGFQMKDVLSVEVFLWDEDPKTSRGTVTTVTPASAY